MEDPLVFMGMAKTEVAFLKDERRKPLGLNMNSN